MNQVHSPSDQLVQEGNGSSRPRNPPALPEGERHAQLMLPAPRKGFRWWVWLVFAAVVGGGGYVGYYYWQQSTQAAANDGKGAGAGRVTPVVAVSARRGDLPIYLDGNGTVAALNMVQLHTRVDGQLVEVNFTEGQDVHKDELLIQIDPRPIQRQIDQYEAQKAKDEAILANARVDLGRYQVAMDAVPKQQLDTAAALVTQGEATVTSDQAVIDAAKLQLDFTKITSPIDGRIGLRNVDVGNQVHASDVTPLATIMQVRPITVVFTLAQDTLPAVQKAMRQKEPAKVLALDSGLAQQIAAGTLTAIDNQIDVASGTYKLKATFDNTHDELFPNQMVNVRLLVDTRKQAVLVPAEAIQKNQQTSFVYVVKEDNTVEMRTVTPGPTEGSDQVIEKGVDAGDRVVTDGLDRLTPGAKVKAQSPEEAAAASQSSGAKGGRRGGAGSKPATKPATKPASQPASQPAQTMENSGESAMYLLHYNHTFGDGWDGVERFARMYVAEGQGDTPRMEGGL